MQLFLFRHGIANNASIGQTDSDRSLTDEGREQLVASCQVLKSTKVAFGSIIHSPFRRAKQTATLVQEVLGGKLTPSKLLVRAPGLELLELLHTTYLKSAQTPGLSTIAVVGHQPWISELTALLTIGDGGLGGHFDFRPGTVAHLFGDPAPGAMLLRGYHQAQTLVTTRP